MAKFSLAVLLLAFAQLSRTNGQTDSFVEPPKTPAEDKLPEYDFDPSIDEAARKKALEDLRRAMADPMSAFKEFLDQQASLMERGDALSESGQIIRKALGDEREFYNRLEVFKANLYRADKQNAETNGESTHGITKFSHLTEVEFEGMFLTPFDQFPDSDPLEKNTTARRLGGCGQVSFPYVSGMSTPSTFNWRSMYGTNYITPVKNQQSCGSCSSFAVTAAAEFSVVLNYGYLGYHSGNTDLAEQDNLECTSGNQCKGAWPSTYMTRMSCKGFKFEKDLPYKAVDTNKCPAGPRYSVGTNKWARPPAHRAGFTQALLRGPTVIAINGKPLQTYVSGCYSCGGSSSLTHAVTVVGYKDSVAMANGQTWQIFYVKNSWGSNWGQSGYFMLRKDCGGAGSLGMYNTAAGVFMQ